MDQVLEEALQLEEQLELLDLEQALQLEELLEVLGLTEVLQLEGLLDEMLDLDLILAYAELVLGMALQLVELVELLALGDVMQLEGLLEEMVGLLEEMVEMVLAEAPQAMGLDEELQLEEGLLTAMGLGDELMVSKLTAVLTG